MRHIDERSDTYHRRVARWVSTVAQFREEEEFGDTSVDTYLVKCQAKEYLVVSAHTNLFVSGVTAVLVSKIRAVADEVVASGGFGLTETNVGRELMALVRGEMVDDEERSEDWDWSGSDSSYTTAVEEMEDELENVVARIEDADLEEREAEMFCGRPTLFEW